MNNEQIYKLAEKTRNENNYTRDFLIGSAGGAASAIVGMPFNKLTDPITSSNYREALKVTLPKDFDIADLPYKNPKIVKVEGKRVFDRTYLQFARDQFRSLIKGNRYTGSKALQEWIPVLGDVAKKGIGFGATGLVVGGLYRVYKDKRPEEKNN